MKKNNEKPKKYRMSLVNKFILLISLTLLISITVLTYEFIRDEKRYMGDKIIQQNIALNEIITFSTESALTHLNPDFLKNIIHKAAESEDIVYSRIVKPSGEIYMSNNKEEWGKIIKDNVTKTDKTLVKNDIYNGEKIKVIITPITINDKKWTVWLGFSLESIKKVVNYTILKNIIIALIILVFSLIITYLVVNKVAKPIKNLTEAVNKISMGDIKVKIDVKSKDEIGDLAKAFKRMVNSLKILMKGYNKK